MDKEESRKLREAMETACEKGDFEKVFELIEGGQDPRHAVSGKKRKPIHYAAFHGNLEVVRTLVEEYGCNPQSRDDNSYTPLHYACYGGHKDVVKYLVTQQKCDPSVKDHKGNLPLYLTCMHEVPATHIVHLFEQYSSMGCEEPTSKPGHYEVAEFLLTEGGCNITGSKKHPSPLVVHLACRYGTAEFVQFLIEQKKCHPNSQNKDKDTPVHLASKYGNVEILRYLVEVKHCSLMQQNKNGNTPLHLACMFQHLETIMYLVRKQQDLTMVANHIKELPTHIACCKDSLDIVKLVTSPSNVTTKAHHNGATPLHVASAHGSLEIVKWLIEELHCDPNIKDNNILDPLHHLWLQDLYYGNLRCNQCSNQSMEHPLHGACRHIIENLYYCKKRINSKKVQMVEYLVARCGCEPMMNAAAGYSLMQIACQEGLEFVEALTSKNVNCVDKHGNSPLHLACKDHREEVVQFLVLERHCRQDIQNDRGELPLHIACSQVSFGSLQFNIISHVLLQNLLPPKALPLQDSGLRKPPELYTPSKQIRLPLELIKLVSACDINVQTKSGDTPVHIACRNSQIDTVIYLTKERHCFLDISNNEGELPLHIACQQKSLEMVKLVSSCDLHAQTKRGFTAMHIACKINAIEIVEYLVQEKCWKLRPKLYDDLLIHCACAKGSAELVRKLANPTNVTKRFPNHLYHDNSKPKDEYNIPGNMPLHEACKGVNVEVVKVVVEEFQSTCDYKDSNNNDYRYSDDSDDDGKIDSGDSGDSGDRSEDGDSGDSCEDGDRSEDGDSSEEDGDSCEDGEGGDSGDSGEDGENSDSWYSACDHKDSGDSVGEVPLQFGHRRQHSLETVELVSSTYDATVQNNAGDTPLHIACKHGQVNIVRYLTEKCVCDPTIQNRSNKLAVHYASQHSLEMVELVSDCDLESRTSHGVTPLHVACLCRKLDIVRYLIENKRCNPDIETSDGLTLLDYAFGKTKYYYEFYPYEEWQIVRDCSDGEQCLIEEKRNAHIAIWNSFCVLCSDDEYTCYSCDYSTGSDATSICNMEHPHELDDEERQAQSAVVKYLTNKCDCDPTNVLSLFVKACKENNLKIAKLFCTNTDIVNSSDAKGNTPLHLACMYEHFGLVKFLTEDRQCSQSVKNQRGELPLHIACHSKQGSTLEMIKLVSSKCDVNAQTVLGDTPLHYACYSGVVEVVQFLTQQCQSNQTIQNKEGELPLHVACGQYSLEVVKLVCNCNVNAQTIKGYTPLHIAKKKAPLSIYRDRSLLQADIAHFLVHGKGADPSVLGGCGHSPIHEACGIGNLDLVKIFTTSTSVNCQDKHGNTPLHTACEQQILDCDHRYLDIAKFLVEESPIQTDTSIQNYHGNLALHNALHSFCEMWVQPLTKLVSSCDPNVKNCDGDTPLHVACRHAGVQCIRYLVKERGCDVLVRNVEGELPLHIAASNLPLNAVKLVEHCEVNSRTVSGDTPLHIACRKGNTKIVQYLLKVLNCNPNMQTSNGNTALHLICKTASCWKDQDLLCYLLKKKLCNPDIQNACGDTPLHIACQAQNLHTVKSIGKFVHNPNLTTLSGDTPLHVACNSKIENEYISRAEATTRIDIVRYLVKTKKCDQTIANNKGELPLHLACKLSVELAKLVSNCNVNFQTVDGNTPLHIACEKEKMDIVKYLTETKQCNANIHNQKGELPLHIACIRGDLEIAMLVCNCNINAVTATGDTPLHLALSDSYHENLVKFLISKLCDFTFPNDEEKLPFHIACERYSLEIVRLVGVCNVNARTKSGDTPLHMACRRKGYPYSGQITEVVEYLVKERHCDVAIQNDNNEFPLHIACEMQTKLETVKLLCNGDVNVNTQTFHSGDTPLHCACRSKYREMEIEKVVKYLVEENYGNPSIQNNNGQLPLHIACSSKSISFELVELLSNCDADFNCRTLTGDTPLHEACKVDTYYPDSKKQVVQFLVEKLHCDPNCNNNTGMTPLHYACKTNEKEIVLYLLSTGKVLPSVTTKNSDGQTPVMLTDDIEIIRELLKQGADPHPLYQRYKQFFKECSSETPLPTPFNVLVLGNASTGKTTLIESLKAEGKSVVQDTSPDAHTAGIIPNRFESREYGLVTFYDFAGQHEYYASHEAVIRTIVRSTPPAIILVVNISESEENIKQKVLYWLSFISNQFPTVTAKPHLIITGSHADRVADHGDNPHTKIESIIDSINYELAMSTAKFTAFTTMDCRVSESPGINGLRYFLQKSSKELKDHGVMNFMSHCFHIYLLEYFKHLPAVSLSQITSCLLLNKRRVTLEDNKPKRLLPRKPLEIDTILEELSEKGHVMFLKSSRRRSSWVILNKEALLGDINGTVFAPVGFKQHKELASNSSTGVVPFSTITRHFPKHDPNMIVSFLSHLEFCHEIADEEVLNLIGGKPPHPTDSSVSSEPYFLFPHLVSIECPQNIWTADDNFEYQCGWLLWCSEHHHFFTSQFLQVILLWLAFSFALDIPIKKHRDHPAIQRRCSIWKNGISWLNEDGIEVVVEMTGQNKVVAVMMHCIRRSATKTECIHLRSSVLQKILSMKEEFCSTVSTTESFINPDELQYPLRPPQDLTLFRLSDVARSVIMTKPCVICRDGSSFVELEKLLLFEPYNNLGEDILKELFDEKKDGKMKDDFLYDIADQIVREADSEDIDQKKEYFLKLFNPRPTLLQERVCRAPEGPTHELVRIFQLWRDCSTDQSYGRLRRKLDEYSVFCGRNPLELIAVEEERC